MPPLIDLLIALPLGACIGFAIGLTGVGGGVLVVPALANLLGLAAPAAVATANIYSFMTKSYAVAEHARLRSIDYRAGMLFLAGALPGTVLATLLVLGHAHKPGFHTGLNVLILGVILLSGAVVIHGLASRRSSAAAAAAATEEDGVGAAAPAPGPARRGPGIALGFLAGALIGGTGVGGGVAVIPILTRAFRLDMVRTVGTSILIAVLLTCVSGALFLILGRNGSASPAWAPAVAMTVGSFPGVWIGARLGRRLGNRGLGVAVVAMVVIAAGAMAYKIAAGQPAGH